MPSSTRTKLPHEGMEVIPEHPIPPRAPLVSKVQLAYTCFKYFKCAAAWLLSLYNAQHFESLLV